MLFMHTNHFHVLTNKKKLPSMPPSSAPSHIVVPSPTKSVRAHCYQRTPASG